MSNEEAESNSRHNFTRQAALGKEEDSWKGGSTVKISVHTRVKVVSLLCLNEGLEGLGLVSDLSRN